MEPILRQGMQGDAVRKLQELLRTKGFYAGDINGEFGEAVREAVINFQVAYDLLADGVVTDEAWEHLQEQSADDSSGFFSPRGFDDLEDDFAISPLDDHDDFTSSPLFGGDDEIDESDLSEDLMATVSPAILAQAAVHEMWSDTPTSPISAPEHFLHSGADHDDGFGAEGFDEFDEQFDEQFASDFGDPDQLDHASVVDSDLAIDLVAAAQSFDLSNSQHAKALDNLQLTLDSNILKEFTRQWYSATETHITSLLEAFISYDYEGPTTQATALEWVQNQLSPAAIQQFVLAWGQPMVRQSTLELNISAAVDLDDLVDPFADELTSVTLTPATDGLGLDIDDSDGHDFGAADDLTNPNAGVGNDAFGDEFSDNFSDDLIAPVAANLTDNFPDDAAAGVNDNLDNDLNFDSSTTPLTNSSTTSIDPPIPASITSITDASSDMPSISSVNHATSATMVSALSNAPIGAGLLSSLLSDDDDDAPDFSDLPPTQLLTQAGRFVPPKQVSLVDAATSYSGLSHQSFALQTLDQKIDDQLRLEFCARWMVGSQDLGLRPDETPDIISLEAAFHGYQPSQTPCQPVALKWLETQLAQVDLENFTKIWFSQNIGLAGRISLYEAANRYDPTRYPGQLEALNYINDQLSCQPALLQQFATRWQSATSGMILSTAPMGTTLKEAFYNFNSDRYPSQILAFAWLERQLSPALLSEFSQRWYQAIRAASEAVPAN